MIRRSILNIESGCRSYAGLTPGVLFPANLPALLPVAAFNVTGDFCVPFGFGSRQIQKNLVSVGCSMVGLAYRNTLAALAVSNRVGRSERTSRPLRYSNPHSLPINKKVLQLLS